MLLQRCLHDQHLCVEILSCKSNNINGSYSECSVNHTWMEHWSCSRTMLAFRRVYVQCRTWTRLLSKAVGALRCAPLPATDLRTIHKWVVMWGVADPSRSILRMAWSTAGKSGVSPGGMRTVAWIPLAGMCPSKCLLAVTWKLAWFLYLQLLIAFQMKSFNGRVHYLKTAIWKQCYI